MQIGSLVGETSQQLGVEVHVRSDRDRVDAVLQDVFERAADHIVIGNRWYPIAPNALQHIREILREATIDRVGPITLKQYLLLNQLAVKYAFIRNSGANLAAADKLNVDHISADTPGFVGKLYPYQEKGVRWLKFVSKQGVGGVLADEMGLGKTVQIAAILVGEDVQPSLVVATGTLLENWRRELAKFAPSLKTVVHRGSDRIAFPDEFTEFDVVITSYDTLVRDLPVFRRISWNIVILDEAQAIKNPGTKRAQSVKRLPRRLGIAVTGTPVENSLTDLWSIADFVLPGFLGSVSDFERVYENNDDGANLLEPLVSPILLRRKVAEVASDLPPRVDIPQVIELEFNQAQLYENIRQETLAQYGPAGGLVALTRLRMYCAHPYLLSPAAKDLAVDSPKYRRLLEILEELIAVGEKALIFTSFNEMTDLLVSDLPTRHRVPVQYIDGRTPINERQKVVDDFSEAKGAGILVLNPRAAGTGLNITAANHVIHYNLEWNPAVEDQASARAYRRGQTRPVTVHRLFYAQTVEEVIDERLARKRNLASMAVVGVDGSEESLADIAAALDRSPAAKRGSSR